MQKAILVENKQTELLYFPMKHISIFNWATMIADGLANCELWWQEQVY